MSFGLVFNPLEFKGVKHLEYKCNIVVINNISHLLRCPTCYC